MLHITCSVQNGPYSLLKIETYLRLNEPVTNFSSSFADAVGMKCVGTVHMNTAANYPGISIHVLQKAKITHGNRKSPQIFFSVTITSAGQLR